MKIKCRNEFDLQFVFLKYLKSLLALFCFIQLHSCENHHSEKRSIVICIQPFGDFSRALSDSIFHQLKQIDSNILLRKQMPLPGLAYYKPRDRYRADSLIKFLEKLANKDTIIIGLTNKDISTNKNNVQDWGVMGLSFCPGKACVVSTFRLSKINVKEQFYKIAIHELGHTQGLPHCKNKTCFMRDAEGGNPTNEEKDFCTSCKSFLKNKGWNLK